MQPLSTSPSKKCSSQTTKDSDPVLCPHCKRTASNGIKCKGICVSDSDY